MFKSILLFLEKRRDRKLREKCIRMITKASSGQYVHDYASEANQLFVFIKNGLDDETKQAKEKIKEASYASN